MDFNFACDEYYDYKIVNENYIIFDDTQRLVMNPTDFDKHFTNLIDIETDSNPDSSAFPTIEEQLDLLRDIENESFRLIDSWYNGEEDLAKSGFEDDPRVQDFCTSVSHTPPTHMVIPNGKRYRHVCPDCGHTQYIYSNNITC
jgi:hypothetical protein